MALAVKKIKTLIKLLEELQADLEGGNDEEEEVDEEEEEEAPPAKPARKGRTPAKNRGKKAAADEEEEEEEEAEDDDDADDDAPTLNELRSLAVKASKKATDGKEKVLAALQRHGTERLTEIDEEHYADLKTMLEKIIEDDDFDPRSKVKTRVPATKKRKAKGEDF